MSGAQLTDDDLRVLLALRSAVHRQAPAPPFPLSVAAELGQLGLVGSQAIPGMLTGGVEITDQGMAELEDRYLFCRAFGCHGILRDWRTRSLPTVIERLQGIGGTLYSLKCPKCGSENALEATQRPRRPAEFKIRGPVVR
jgi:hypothetical protein